jgi:hypothetical protein
LSAQGREGKDQQTEEEEAGANLAQQTGLQEQTRLWAEPG